MVVRLGQIAEEIGAWIGAIVVLLPYYVYLLLTAKVPRSAEHRFGGRVHGRPHDARMTEDHR